MFEAWMNFLLSKPVALPPNTGSLYYNLWRRSILTKDFMKKHNEVKSEKMDLLNWTAHIFSQAPGAEDSWDNSLGRGYLSTKQIAAVGTFLPEELITLVHSGRRFTTFVGAIMMADISGFTTLCETYAKFGPEGAFRLTAMLNSYIGAMVDLIYTFGGDLIKFAGDAFIAVWHCRLYDRLSYKVHEAVSCAMHIQYSLGTYRTDVGVMLKVKVAVSAGNFVFCLNGDEFNSSYIIYGYPVLEVKRAEGMAESGDTIIAPSAWNLVSPRNYSFEPLTEGYVKMKRILYDPRVMTREVFDFDSRQLVEINIKNETLKNLTRKTDLVSSTMEFEENIRPNLFGPAIRGISEELRPFVIAPVMQQIDANSSFEYLTEMRQVTIMFVKMKPNTTLESSVIKITDKVYCTISKIVKSKLGLINKVCMFDKDIMYLVIFGMKGFKEKDEALRCLRCAYQIHSSLASEELIKSLSTGVTIGTTYCGVVGHPFRKEYTVIGGAVNRAARLMCAFNNVISCDHPVVLNSKLPLAYFKRLPPKYLKGIGQVTNIYQYEEKGLDASKIPPILGRTDVMAKYRDILMGRSKFKGVFVVGDPRCGKSRLLNEFVEISEALQWKSIWISVHNVLSHGICLLHKVFANMLGRTIKERMASLIRLYVDDQFYEYLYVLNDVFDVNFAFPYGCKTPVEMTPLFLFRRTLKLLSKPTVIIVDDAHGLDYESWSVFLDVIQHPEYIIVFSLPSAWQSKQISVQQCMKSSKVVTFHLETLHIGCIPAVVCQMLNVDAVPRKLVKILVKLSRGSPGWVQTFLLSYIEAGFIAIKLAELATLSTSVYIIPDQIMLKPIADANRSPDRKSFSSDTATVVPICRIVKTLDENSLPVTFDDVIMSMFDQQSSFEQLLLKCASVLGTSFYRSDLIHVMGGPPELHVAPAIKRLFQLHLLGCAENDKNEASRNQNCNSENQPNNSKDVSMNEVKCNCNIMPEDNLHSLPNYAYCKHLSFKFSVFCTTINATIPMNQKIQFHARALQSIKLRSQKCEFCRINEQPEEKKSFSDNIEPKLSNAMSNDRGRKSTMKSVDITDDESVEYNERFFKYSGSISGSKSSSAVKDLRQFQNRNLEEENAVLKQDRGFLFHVLDIVKAFFHRKPKVVINYFDLGLPKAMKCACFFDLSAMYEQLVHHAKMAELLVVELKYLIAFSIHCINYSKFDKAVQLLKEAESARERCLTTMTQDIPTQYMKYTKRQISAYLGKSYLNLGNTIEALSHLTSLVKTLDKSFLFWVEVLVQNWPEVPLVYRKKLKREMIVKTVVHSALSQTYVFKNDLKTALSVAMDAATFARATDDLRYRCTAFTMALDLNVMKGKFRKAHSLEMKYLKSAYSLYDASNVTGCVAMGVLYTSIFKSRYYSGKIHECIEAGIIALRLAQATFAIDAEMWILKRLCFSLLMTRNLELLQECLHPNIYMKEEINTYQHVAKMKLYHCLILEAFLEGSVALENPIRIFSIMKKTVNRRHMEIEHPGARASGITVWLWYLRKGEFNRAAGWQLPEYPDLDVQQESLRGLLQIIQCQLLWLEFKMRTNIYFSQRMEACSQNLRFLFKFMKKKVYKLARYLLPRYYHMRAYYVLLSYDDFGAKSSSLPGFSYLLKAHKHAEDQGNFLEQSWISHSRRLWYKPEKIGDPDFWVNHMDDDAVGVEDFDNYNWPDITFSLKVPERIYEEIRRLRSYVSLPDSISIASSKEGDEED